MSKHIQITEELYINLCRYFLLSDTSPELEKAIKTALNDKLDKLARRQAYTTSKTANTAEERERARLEYLDMVGMRDSFRW